MMKRMILAVLALLLAAPGALAELPDSIQIVVGETYDFGEAISGAEGIASISGTALTGTAQGIGNVTSADDSCFVVVRDPNAIAYLYGISRLEIFIGDAVLVGNIFKDILVCFSSFLRKDAAFSTAHGSLCHSAAFGKSYLSLFR